MEPSLAAHDFSEKLDDEHVLSCVSIHGTTIVSFYYKDGIMLSVDSRESSTPISIRQYKKDVASNGGKEFAVGRRGRAYDACCKYLTKGNIILIHTGRTEACEQLEMWLLNHWPLPIEGKDFEQYCVNEIKEKVKQRMNERLSDMAYVIAGWNDKSKQLELWVVETLYDNQGRFIKAEARRGVSAFEGSGGSFAKDKFEKECPPVRSSPYDYNLLSENEAKKLALHCLYDASFFDNGTGGKFHVFKVNCKSTKWLGQMSSMEASIGHIRSRNLRHILLMASTNSEKYKDIYCEDFEQMFGKGTTATLICCLAKSGMETNKGFYLYRVRFPNENLARSAMNSAEAQDTAYLKAEEESNHNAAKPKLNLHHFFGIRRVVTTSASLYHRSNEEQGRLDGRWMYMDWYTEELLRKLNSSCEEILPLRRRQ